MLTTSSRINPRAALCCLASLVVAALGAAVSLDSTIPRLDLAVVQILHRLSSDEKTALAVGLTEIAATKTVLIVAAVAAALLLVRGHWHGSIAVCVSITATQAIVFGIKALVARGRPPASSSLVDAAGHAFPSAHAASGMALYGLLALYMIQRLHGRARLAACALALVGVGSVGLTRVYLGAHYPTDVLAGWLVGAVIGLGAWHLGRALHAWAPSPAVA